MSGRLFRWLAGGILVCLAAFAGHRAARAVLPPSKSMLAQTFSTGKKVIVGDSNGAIGGRSQRQLRDALFRQENGLPAFAGKPGDPVRISVGTAGVVLEEDAGVVLVRFLMAGGEESLWVRVDSLQAAQGGEKGD